MDDVLLAIYLKDHLTAATGGLGLAERARDAQHDRDEELHRALARLAGEIRDDRRVLVDALRALGARPDPLKLLAAAVAERLGRLKPNGRLVRRSPLSDVVELEGLTIAVQGKRAGWILLREIGHPRLAGIDFEALIARADDQSERIEEQRLTAARRALGDTGTAAEHASPADA